MMLEKIAFVCLSFVALCWLGAVLVGVVVAFPFGLIGLIGIVGIGLLIIKVVTERLSNPEDDHYSKNVEK